MATFFTNYAQTQLNAKGAKTNGYPNAGRMQRTLQIGRDTYTTTGTETITDGIRIGNFIPHGSILNVENCRIRVAANVLVGGNVGIWRVNTGSWLTGGVNVSAGGNFGWNSSASPVITFNEGDIYEIRFSGLTSVVAGQTVHIDIAYETFG